MKRKTTKGSVKPLETAIQKSICDYLSARKHFFWRQNTGGMFRDGRYFATPKYSKNGVPDIILVKDGRFIGLEVKRPQGRLSEAQEAFKKGLEAVGGMYAVVTSIDEVQALGL
jgi:hypothetical protein